MIQFTEFIVGSCKKLLLLSRDNINMTFNWLDHDRDGRITSKDVATVFKVDFQEFPKTELGKSYQEFHTRGKQLVK